MGAVTLHPSRCAICDTYGNATELYPANFDESAFNPETFSARRLPDRVHYRMVRCDTCGLVRSDPVADSQALAQLYSRSKFDYGAEVEGIKRTYGRYLAKLERLGGRKSSLLEIGCGNGFFLEQALAQGYSTVRGVEPGRDVWLSASPKVRDQIVCDVMREGLFAPGQFDAVCMFQVFDHLPEPAAVLAECFRVLKAGGHLLILNHNVEALSARLMKARSPIIDIEHTYLYDPTTLGRIVAGSGFRFEQCGRVVNTYSLNYLLRLLPLPRSVKFTMLKALMLTPLRGVPISVPLGNLYLIAQKPHTERRN